MVSGPHHGAAHTSRVPSSSVPARVGTRVYSDARSLLSHEYDTSLSVGASAQSAPDATRRAAAIATTDPAASAASAAAAAAAPRARSLRAAL